MRRLFGSPATVSLHRGNIEKARNLDRILTENNRVMGHSAKPLVFPKRRGLIMYWHKYKMWVTYWPLADGINMMNAERFAGIFAEWGLCGQLSKTQWLNPGAGNQIFANSCVHVFMHYALCMCACVHVFMSTWIPAQICTMLTIQRHCGLVGMRLNSSTKSVASLKLWL